MLGSGNRCEHGNCRRICKKCKANGTGGGYICDHDTYKYMCKICRPTIVRKRYNKQDTIIKGKCATLPTVIVERERIDLRRVVTKPIDININSNLESFIDVEELSIELNLESVDESCTDLKQIMSKPIVVESSINNINSDLDELLDEISIDLNIQNDNKSSLNNNSDLLSSLDINLNGINESSLETQVDTSSIDESVSSDEVVEIQNPMIIKFSRNFIDYAMLMINSEYDTNIATPIPSFVTNTVADSTLNLEEYLFI